MKPKKYVAGIKFPDGQIKNLMIFAPSKDGYVLTVPHSNIHVTLLTKNGFVSSHVKNQISGNYEHLGELSKSKEYNDIIERALGLRKLNEEEYDTIVLYFTQKGIDLFNEPKFVWIEKKSKNQTSTYLDLPSMISKAKDTAIELSKSPKSFFGLCHARDLISNKEIEVGISNIQEKIGIIEIDGDLYEIDLSSFLDLETKSPLYEILEPLGIPILYKDIQKRLQDIIQVRLDEKNA